jgi:hypothetical protein
VLLPSPPRTKYRLQSALWSFLGPEDVVVGPRPHGNGQFHRQLEFSASGDVLNAAAVGLTKMWHALGPVSAPVSGPDTHRLPSEIADRVVGNLSSPKLAHLICDAPLCLWRARDGWLAAHIGQDAAWRDFCATYLNAAAYRDISAHAAWKSQWVHMFATTVLDTHRVEDVLVTCETYDIPIAAVPGWQDGRSGGVAKRLSEVMAWAILEQI